MSDDSGFPNATYNKRGFADLRSASALEGCDLASSDDCHPNPCNFESDEHCVFDVWLRISSEDIPFMYKSGHEFGHMLGFNHEHFRPDRDEFIDADDCKSNPTWNNRYALSAAHFIGHYDTDSVMHYPENYDPAVAGDPTHDYHTSQCFRSKPAMPIDCERNTDMPTGMDLAKLQLMYGVRGDWVSNEDPGWCVGSGREIHLGNFDGDDHKDLLCHSARPGSQATGRRWLDYSNTLGHFTGSNWDSGSGQYCWGSSRTLLTGDFNGDSKDDVLCYNGERGTVTIDYASDTGELSGQDWPGTGVQAWGCDHEGSRAYVGRFNNDEKDDLLCHNLQTGRRWIDWASASGHFEGPDWMSANAWCFGESKRLVLGDFNRDGRDDALCHNTDTGHRQIDFASDRGELKGTDWDSTTGAGNAFCWSAERTLHVADVTGDRADDLLCHNERIGSVAVDVAVPSLGTAQGVGLGGEDAYYDLAFCSAKDAQLLVGAFNHADRREDLLCHNRVTGHKAVLYARDNGTYRIPQGY